MKKRATPKKVIAAATARLHGLLKSPKTKEGLNAALADLDLSIHFLSGWLSREMKAGRVMQAHRKFEGRDQYVMCCTPVEPPNFESVYPAWLDCRNLPAYDRRHYCANLDHLTPQQEQEESEMKNEETYRRSELNAERSIAGW